MLKDHNSTYDLDISERPLRTRKKKLIALVGREVERMMINFFFNFPLQILMFLKVQKVQSIHVKEGLLIMERP